MGHVVSAAGAKVAVDKVDALELWPTPTYVCEMQGFLGLTNFYSRLIKGFAAIAKPLTDLTQKAIKCKSEATAEFTLETLKKASTSAPVL